MYNQPTECVVAKKRRTFFPDHEKFKGIKTLKANKHKAFQT